MNFGLKRDYSKLRHVRGAREDLRWTVFHLRASTIDKRAWLSRKGCPEIFLEELFRYKKQFEFYLYAYVVMPEHIHLVLMPTDTAGISEIMMNIKRRSAWRMNQCLHRKGQFWLEDYFDHWERNSKQTAEAIGYVHNNPVRRKLVARPEDYPYSSYLAWEHPELCKYKIDRECF